jgi:hypothetical protein
MLVAAQVSSMKTSCSGFSSGCCAPGAPCRGDVGPILLGGVPGLFFRVSPQAARKRLIAAGLTWMASAARRVCSSAMVRAMEQRIKDQLTIRLGVMMAGGIVIMAASVKLL